jgi:hypothetical protein
VLSSVPWSALIVNLLKVKRRAHAGVSELCYFLEPYLEVLVNTGVVLKLESGEAYSKVVNKKHE